MTAHAYRYRLPGNRGGTLISPDAPTEAAARDVLRRKFGEEAVMVEAYGSGRRDLLEEPGRVRAARIASK